MATVNDCFPLFFENNQTHRTTKVQSTKPQKQAFQTRVYVYVFLEIMFIK